MVSSQREHLLQEAVQQHEAMRIQLHYALTEMCEVVRCGTQMSVAVRSTQGLGDGASMS